MKAVEASTLSVFSHDDYVDYLRAWLSDASAKRGRRAELSRALSCQPSFISQVLALRSHLSLEHAILVSDHVKHSSEERAYFMLLVHKGKAGSARLQRHFQEQIDQIRERRQMVRERIQVAKEIKPNDQAVYYSAWWYTAIHVLTALPGTQTRTDISRKLKLADEIVAQALEFLIRAGLVIEKSGKLSMGQTRVHLGPRSPLIARHHSNWRMKSIEAIERMDSQGLHYSGVIGVSRADAKRIRTYLLDVLQKSEAVLRDSKEEAPYLMAMDFYEL
jgi:uncharacterized protein (TIGR02147 family)